MPSRSNDFQKLITVIERQLAPEGATVRESVMLKEIDSDEEREVDVLIESKTGQHDIRIAVECRDHTKKQGKSWIDYLQGRYAHLPVNKVVAVSRAGWWGTAERHAAKANLTLMSLDEAFDADWVEQVARYEMGMMVWRARLVRARPIYLEVGPETLSPTELKACQIGPAVGPADSTLEDDVLALYRDHNESVLREWSAENFDTTWAAGPGVEYDLNVPFEARDRVLHAPNGDRYPLRAIHLTLRASFELRTARPKYYTYGEAKLATGDIADAGDGNRYTFTMQFGDDGVPRALDVRTSGED